MYNSFEEESFDKKNTGKIFIKLLKLLRPVWSAFLGITILMIIVAIGEAYYPMVAQRVIDNSVTPSIILRNTDTAVEKLVGEKIIEGESPISDYIPDYTARMYTEIGIFFAIWFVIGMCVYGFIRLAGITSEKSMYFVRKKVFTHIQKLSFSYFDKTPVGWIMARVTSDIERFSEVVAWHLVDFVWGFASILIMSIVMLSINWRLALIVIASIPILFVISWYFRNKILKFQREVRKTNSKITANFNESINGAKVIKSLVQHKRMHNEFKTLTHNFYKPAYKAGWFQALYLSLIIFVSSIVISIVLIVGGNMHHLSIFGGITVGVLTLFLNYIIFFFEPINQIAHIFAELQIALASAERVLSLLDTEPEIIDESHATDPGNIKGLIEFKNVSFAYEKDKYILKNFSLKVETGQTVAIVGPTGAGKSTIINLICRFYEPTEGQILIDNEDYRNRTLHSLHSRLGIVLQTPHLFSGTIKENIKYGKLGASDDEVIKAAKLVNADKFIKKLTKTYDENVGESGNLLSTGEKQLISFARAAIVNPQIFIMDEATSSVDTLTEKFIQDGMHNMLEGKTCFIIAHRLSTIKSADRIIVIKDGVIEEDGSHRELLIKKGHYYNLYTKQLREEKEQELGLVKSDVVEGSAS